jgi:hypothetical protein
VAALTRQVQVAQQVSRTVRWKVKNEKSYRFRNSKACNRKESRYF